MRKHSVLYGALAIAAVGLLAACGDDSSPVKPSPLTPSPIAGIEVVGPDSLRAGQSAQFVANIRQADGTTKSATSMPNLRWSSSNTSVASVSNSGVVTAATPWAVGEAVITAAITQQGVFPGTRRVVIGLTAALEVSQQGAPGQRTYVFAVTLTESSGVSATVTGLLISLDDGVSGECIWTPDKLGETRLPANGTLALGPLACGYEGSSNVGVSIDLTYDNGHATHVGLLRWL